jgi:hypothetical protein
MYTLILFSHVAATFFLFAGLALEWLAANNLRRRLDRAQADSWIHLVRIAPWFYGPAFGVVLLSGCYLAATTGWNHGWIVVSFVTLLVIGLIGAFFTGPRVRAIHKIAKEASDQISTALENLLTDPVLLASVRLRVALVLGILVLMVSKLDVWWSLATVAEAASLGLIMTVSGWWESSNPLRGNSQLTVSAKQLHRQTREDDASSLSGNVAIVIGPVAEKRRQSQSTISES